MKEKDNNLLDEFVQYIYTQGIFEVSFIEQWFERYIENFPKEKIMINQEVYLMRQTEIAHSSMRIKTFSTTDIYKVRLNEFIKDVSSPNYTYSYLSGSEEKPNNMISAYPSTIFETKENAIMWKISANIKESMWIKGSLMEKRNISKKESLGYEECIKILKKSYKKNKVFYDKIIVDFDKDYKFLNYRKEAQIEEERKRREEERKRREKRKKLKKEDCDLNDEMVF